MAFNTIVDTVSEVTEADFLARVAAFERNEREEKKRAIRFVREQLSPPNLTLDDGDDAKRVQRSRRRDRSPDSNGCVGPNTSRSRQENTPPRSVLAFHPMHGNGNGRSRYPTTVYPFVDIPSSGGPPRLQDAHVHAHSLSQALVFASVPRAGHQHQQQQHRGSGHLSHSKSPLAAATATTTATPRLSSALAPSSTLCSGERVRQVHSDRKVLASSLAYYDLRSYRAPPAPPRTHLLKSACAPRQQSMTIICNLFPWIIAIHPSFLDHITLHDVLYQVHQALHRPLTLDEWTSLSHLEQRHVELAWLLATMRRIPQSGLYPQQSTSWIKKLRDKCFDSAPSTSSVPGRGGELDDDDGGLWIRRRRSREQGILRLDVVVARLMSRRGAFPAPDGDKAVRGSRRTTATASTAATMMDVLWGGLVRDDVLARRKGFEREDEWERCWSLLLE